MKKNILMIMIFLVIVILSGDERYSENVHEYLMEQSYDLLKIDQEHEFPEMNEYFESLIKGAKNEDKQDWVYHYNENNPPDFNQWLLPEIIVQIGLDLFNDGGDPFVTITHFWGADGGFTNSSFLSGDHPLYWSFSCENAMQKVTKFLNDPFIPHYSFNDYHFEEEDQLAFGYHYIQVVDLFDFYQIGYCKVYNNNGFIGWFHLIETEKLAVFYETIGRICHLMMDMSVPAHAHEDQHAPVPLCSDGDQYEGSLDEDFGFMIDPENWYWESLNTYLTKGGLLDISGETDPLLYLMYITNQVADFFASDDVDGNSNLWNDPSVLNANSFLQSKFTELESQGYTEDHPIRTHHEMQLWGECPAIRNNVFPLAMRTVATFLEYIAQEINLTANFLPPPFCFVQGSVSLNGGGGDIEEVSILFEPQDLGPIIELNPDNEGNFLYAFGENRYGTYDVTYELFSSNGNYYPFTDEDVEIDQGTLTLPIVDLIPIPLIPDAIIVNQDDLGDFTNIKFAVLAVDQSATIFLGPGIYTGENNKNISWNGNEKNITIWGSNMSVIDCENNGRAFTINNGTEEDIIKGITIINTNSNYSAGGAIKIVNGCPQVIENTFNNCSSGDYPGYYIADGGAILIQNANGAQIKNNIFVDNSAFSGGAIYAHSSSNITISDNTFTNNTSGHIYDSSDGSTGIAGAVHIALDSNATISNNLFQENVSNNGSAALAYENSTGEIVNNRFDSNKFGAYDTLAEFEGNILGVYYDSYCEIYDNTFSDNYSYSYLSGIILLSYGTSVIYNNTFINNVDLEKIIYFENPTNEIITNCLFSNNETNNVSWGDVTLNYCNTYQSGNLGFGVIVGEGCLIGIDPLLNLTTHQPIWNSTTKSPCIDSGDGLDSDGTPADIGAVHAITHKYDIVELPSPAENNGWKWLSFPALDNVYSTTGYDPDVAEYLLDDILDPTILDKVYAQNYTIEYWNSSWLHDYEQFLRTEGFKFHMNDDAELDVPGFKVNDNTEIVLNGNNVENWVGYWLDETQHVSDAFAQYWNGGNIVYIQHQFWSAARRNGVWYYRMQIEHGSLQPPTLSYGDMVVVKCNTTINDFGWVDSGIQVDKTIFTKPEYFTYEEQADYVPLFIELDKENMPQEIGAFVDGVCIGAVVVEDTLTQINAYATSAPPGNIELELYYGGRSENKHLSTYNCVTFSQPNTILTKLSTTNNDDAWFVNLREDSEMIPGIVEFSASNYPNPFNPTTTIAYSLPNDGMVEVSVYNIKGQLVKTLVNGEQLAGNYETVWNGKDKNEKRVSTGIYFYRVETKDKTLLKKMLMLK